MAWRYAASNAAWTSRLFSSILVTIGALCCGWLLFGDAIIRNQRRPVYASDSDILASLFGLKRAKWELHPIEFEVRRFSVRELVSTCFEVDVWATTPNDDVDLDGLVGFPAGLRLGSSVTACAGRSRIWTGICCHAEQVATEATGVSGYFLKIVPPLWLLSHRKNYRVFQHNSVVDIVSALLAEWGIDCAWHLAGDYATFGYRVQYDESDLAFVSRLLEESGISYDFRAWGGSFQARLLRFAARQRAGKLRVLALSRERHPRAGPCLRYRRARGQPNQSGAPHSSRLRLPQTGGFALFATSSGKVPLETGLEQYKYAPGSFAVEAGSGGDTPVADNKGAVRAEEKQGQFRAERGLEAQRAFRTFVTFRTNELLLAPGMVLAVTGHSRHDLGEAALLLATEFHLEGTWEGPWVAHVQAVQTNTPFRPTQKTPRPVVSSVQSAVVVGPRASEVHTDEFGRVRVQFHWDRESQYDDNSSCWIRVSQGWAGTGFGLIAIPRVGQEVLVGFLDGNPDEPVVVGRVFNNLARPSMKLPQFATQSAWRSQSVPGGDGYNELMFEDAKGNELVNIQAQRNLTKLVKVDEREVTGSNQMIQVGINRSAHIGKVDSIVVGEKHIITVDKSQTGMEMTDKNISHSTGAASSSMSGGNFSLNASGNVAMSAGGNIGMSAGASVSATAGADIALTAGGNLAGSAGADVSLKAGGNMSLEAGGDVSITAGGSLSIKAGGPISIVGADIVIHGGTVKIN